MSATVEFESAITIIELAGLFMVLLPMLCLGAMAIAHYYKKKG